MRTLRWIGDNGALILTIAWIAILFLAFAAPLLVAVSPKAATVAYMALKPLCHQISERSFHILGNKMGLCGRCTGIFSGLVLFGVISLIAGERWRISVVAMIVFIAPMAIDGLAESFGLWNTSNIARFITGFLTAFGIVFCIYPIIFELRSENSRIERIS